jgi:hypothetical protein
MPLARSLCQETQAKQSDTLSGLSTKHAAINERLRSEQSELAAIREKLLNQSRVPDKFWVTDIQRAANTAQAEQAILCLADSIRQTRCYQLEALEDQREQLNSTYNRLRSERCEQGLVARNPI